MYCSSIKVVIFRLLPRLAVVLKYTKICPFLGLGVHLPQI